MLGNELKAFISEMGISQADFARLVGVTSRAVTLWLAEERAIPGPVESYVRLLQVLPGSMKYIELNRLKEKGTAMRDGMYGITFQGQQGTGQGVLIFDSGRIYGTDTEGVRFDGDYIFHDTSGLADVKVKVTFPPNVKAVFGISNPYEWSIDVTTALNPMRKSGPLSLKTSLGKAINAQYVFLRSLPEAA
jgi:transcriptional regulator with XRE-family HTH domain